VAVLLNGAAIDAAKGRTKRSSELPCTRSEAFHFEAGAKSGLCE
jgi:hypothetical protein